MFLKTLNESISIFSVANVIKVFLFVLFFSFNGSFVFFKRAIQVYYNTNKGHYEESDKEKETDARKPLGNVVRLMGTGGNSLGVLGK